MSNASSLIEGASATMLAAQSFSVPPPHAELTRTGCSTLRAVVGSARRLRLAGAAWILFFVVVATRPPPLSSVWIPGAPGSSPSRRTSLFGTQVPTRSTLSSTHARPTRSAVLVPGAHGSAVPQGTLSSRPHALHCLCPLPGTRKLRCQRQAPNLFPAPTRQPGRRPRRPHRATTLARLSAPARQGRCYPDPLVNQRICVDRT